MALTAEDKAAQKRQKHYGQFRSWAIRTISDGIIKDGFKSLDSSLYMILNAYRNGDKKQWNESIFDD